MSTTKQSLLEDPRVTALLSKASGIDHGRGNERVKKITHRLLSDLFRIIEEYEVTPDEFWAAAAYLTKLGQANEVGLLIPGLGIEAFLDIRTDQAELAAGMTGGTPRTIEGPLYVAGAPLTEGTARLDDGTDRGEVLFVAGQVKDAAGTPLPGAVVDVWHANALGGYSFFDPAQKPFNLRRRVKADSNGRYAFRTILPAGYACPPNGPTVEYLRMLGRHGRRPAHIHFFVTAPRHRRLTTQINIDGDTYLHDDFAFATRDGLIPSLRRITDAAAMKERGLNAPFLEIQFDFVLHRDRPGLPNGEVNRVRATA